MSGSVSGSGSGSGSGSVSGPADFDSIGPYRIIRRLGFGRESEVLLATRRFPGNFERRVVIKRLLAPSQNDPERQTVLATEALAYARVAHPAVVQLFDFFAHEGHLALVLEYVDGLSLAKVLERLRARREPIGDRVALFIASRVFAGLAAAHSARDPRTGETTPVIHRDVSPENVLVPWDGFVKLGDFDLAKVIGVSGDTRSGLMKGTYGYMAPEQVNGDAVTPLTDVYAGCLVLRELLISKPTFDEQMPELELLRAMAEAQLPPIESLRGGIPRRLADALRRGLARDPSERTLTAAEMVEVLRGQADMEQAHGELITVLERLRRSEARGTSSQHAITPPSGLAIPNAAPPAKTSPSSSRWHFPTPRSMTVPRRHESMPPVEPVAHSIPVPPRVGRLVPILAGTCAIGILALAFAIGRALSSPTPPLASDQEPDPVAPASAAKPISTSVAPPAPPPAPTAPPTTGMLLTPASAHRHRVWIDGQLAAWSSGVAIRLTCGAHVVRIGSGGSSQSVRVPCGGEVSVDAK